MICVRYDVKRCHYVWRLIFWHVEGVIALMSFYRLSCGCVHYARSLSVLYPTMPWIHEDDVAVCYALLLMTGVVWLWFITPILAIFSDIPYGGRLWPHMVTKLFALNVKKLIISLVRAVIEQGGVKGGVGVSQTVHWKTTCQFFTSFFFFAL